jgi:hypothetical protein
MSSELIRRWVQVDPCRLADPDVGLEDLGKT